MTKSRRAHQIRMIGGQWRGRKIDVMDAEGLRPTSDRLRETLFNWLQFDIAGKKCLDLFAGAGGLGFEAASRGASRVAMIECDPQVFQQLQANQKHLSADQCLLHQTSAFDYLAASSCDANIVFVDPPFRAGLLDKLIPLLDDCAKHAMMIYLEAENEWKPAVPDRWELKKEKRAGKTTARLYQLKV